MELICVSLGLPHIADGLGRLSCIPGALHAVVVRLPLAPALQTASDAGGWPSPISLTGGTDPALAFGSFYSLQLGLETISQRKIKACELLWVFCFIVCFFFLGLEQPRHSL